jgi:hypothetical protein
MVLRLGQDSTDLKLQFAFLPELPHSCSYCAILIEVRDTNHFDTFLQVYIALVQHAQSKLMLKMTLNLLLVAHSHVLESRECDVPVPLAILKTHDLHRAYYAR